MGRRIKEKVNRKRRQKGEYAATEDERSCRYFERRPKGYRRTRIQRAGGDHAQRYRYKHNNTEQECVEIYSEIEKTLLNALKDEG